MSNVTLVPPATPTSAELQPRFGFTHLGGDLGAKFDAALARCGMETDAAIREERTALALASDRVHDRLDSFQRGEDLKLSVPVAAPVPQSAPEPEPAGELDERAEKALSRFNEAHDAEEATPGPAAETAEPVPAMLPAPAAEGSHSPRQDDEALD